MQNFGYRTNDILILDTFMEWSIEKYSDTLAYIMPHMMGQKFVTVYSGIYWWKPNSMGNVTVISQCRYPLTGPCHEKTSPKGF